MTGADDDYDVRRGDGRVAPAGEMTQAATREVRDASGNVLTDGDSVT